MKLNSIIILAVVLSLLALLHFCTGSKPETKKDAKKSSDLVYVPVMEVENKMRTFYLESYGQLSAGQTLDIAFEVSGRLIEGDIRLRPGVRFSKGQLLYSVDSEEAKFAVRARKSAYITLLAQVMPDIKLDFLEEFTIWDTYLSDIDIDNPLPQLPLAKSKKLALLLNQRNIIAEYNNIKSQELRLQKHKYYAPFAGTVTDVFLEPGSIVNPGVRIASSLRTGDYELKIPIRMEELSMYQKNSKVDVFDTYGKQVGVARLTRVSDVVNRMTQSLDAYFSIIPISGAMLYNGMYVNIKLNKETFSEVVALPYLAVKDNQVRVIRDSSIIKVPIQIMASFPDTLLVKGLDNKAQVLINSSEFIADSLKVVGIPK